MIVILSMFLFGCENIDLSKVSDEQGVQEPSEPIADAGQDAVPDFKKPDKGIPETVLAKYEEMKVRYEKSLGANVQSCIKNNEMIYTVSGSGGFTGVTFYYNEEGNEIGSYEFTDVIDNNKPSPPPSIDIKEYECFTIKDSGQLPSPKREIIDPNFDCSEESVGSMKGECIVVDSADRSCQSDSDCVLVEHICGECGFAPINKIHKEKYENQLNELCVGVNSICGVALPDGVTCYNNKCVFFNEN